MEGFRDNTRDCNFINHWTTKVGLKKPKCTMQTVVMCKSTVLWCMSNDLQYIDGKKEDISSVCAAWRISHGLDVTFWACPRNVDICRRKERKKMRQQYRYSNNMSSQFVYDSPFLFCRALSKFSSAATTAVQPPERMCESMKGSLIKKQVRINHISEKHFERKI